MPDREIEADQIRHSRRSGRQFRSQRPGTRCARADSTPRAARDRFAGAWRVRLDAEHQVHRVAALPPRRRAVAPSAVRRDSASARVRPARFGMDGASNRQSAPAPRLHSGSDSVDSGAGRSSSTANLPSGADAGEPPASRGARPMPRNSATASGARLPRRSGTARTAAGAARYRPRHASMEADARRARTNSSSVQWLTESSCRALLQTYSSGVRPAASSGRPGVSRIDDTAESPIL